MSSQFIRYVNASGASFIVLLALPIILVEGLDWLPRTAYGLSLGVVLVLNFLTMRLFVYESDGFWGPQVLRYLVLAAIMRLSEFFIFSLVSLLGAAHYTILIVAISAASAFAKFFLYRLAVFGNGASRE